MCCMSHLDAVALPRQHLQKSTKLTKLAPMRAECAINMCNKYEAIEWQVHEPKMVSREIRPSNFPEYDG